MIVATMAKNNKKLNTTLRKTARKGSVVRRTLKDLDAKKQVKGGVATTYTSPDLLG
jgi:hypothetical protein